MLSLHQMNLTRRNTMIFEKQVEQAFGKAVRVRCDDMGTAYYFSADDFPGLKKEPYAFENQKGERLQGYFYHYDSPKPYRIVVFDHGMGGGHRSYMKEIECLAKKGYLVFAYDHTGCMESEGAHINGFTQSLADLHAALSVLEKDPSYSAYTFSVVGHSWGGYSTLNIAALHPEITHVVAISGFLSAEQMLRQTFGGIMKPYYRRMYAMERDANPDYFDYTAEKSLSDYRGKALVIHSADDRVVHIKSHFQILKKALGDRDNIRFLEVRGKGHNPNYTADAVRYKDAYLAELKREGKRGNLKSEESRRAFVAKFDWNRMTAQDDSVWSEIFTLLES